MLKRISGATIAAAACFGVSASSAGTMLASWYGQVSTAGSQPTAKFTICTDLPPHIKPFLSVQNYVFATKDAPQYINDRGPYIGYRELDLSYAAAKEAGLVHPGVAILVFLHLINNIFS